RHTPRRKWGAPAWSRNTAAKESEAAIHQGKGTRRPRSSSVKRATKSTLEPKAGVATVRSPDANARMAQPCPAKEVSPITAGCHHASQGMDRLSKGKAKTKTRAMAQKLAIKEEGRSAPFSMARFINKVPVGYRKAQHKGTSKGTRERVIGGRKID